MLSIKEAKAIAGPFIGIKLHWDRQQHLWVLTDRKNEAPSNWINSGHLKSMTPEYWLEYCESYAGEVAEHHGDDIISDTGEAAEHTCGIDPPILIECSEVHKARARGEPT